MKDLVKLVVCWIAFVAASIASGIANRILHLPAIELPGSTNIQSLFLTQLAAGVVLVVGLYPLARGLAARGIARAAAVGAFLLIGFGVNGIIETRLFTHFLDHGVGGAAAYYASLAVFLGAAIGYFFGSPGQPAGFSRRSMPTWFVRASAAWIAWPLIYLFFGACILPVVVPYYRAGIAGLQLPDSMSIVIGVQLIRSVFFLATSLPFIALWKGSRRNLWFTLGLAHAFTIGLYGLVGAIWLPPILRLMHGIEMACDAFAYAGLLVLLFAATPEQSTAKRVTEIGMFGVQAAK